MPSMMRSFDMVELSSCIVVNRIKLFASSLSRYFNTDQIPWYIHPKFSTLIDCIKLGYLSFNMNPIIFINSGSYIHINTITQYSKLLATGSMGDFVTFTNTVILETRGNSCPCFILFSVISHVNLRAISMIKDA